MPSELVSLVGAEVFQQGRQNDGSVGLAWMDSSGHQDNLFVMIGNRCISNFEDRQR